MNHSVIRRYCKRVGRCLLCSKAHKKVLLSGLQEELLDRQFPDTISMKELYKQIGSPRKMALQFQTTLDASEIQAVQKRRTRRIVLPLVLFVAILCGAFAIAIYIVNSNEPAYYKDYISDDNSSGDTGIVWYSDETIP